MFFRHRTTKAVRDVNGNSPEGRDLAASDEWDRIEGPTKIDPADVPEPGVVDAPTTDPEGDVA